jgi:hypothetical protein
VEQVFRIRNVFLRSSACLALCLTGCPSNSKTVQERQALEGELKLSQIVIEAREPTVDDDPIWKTSENAPALCKTSSFDHASLMIGQYGIQLLRFPSIMTLLKRVSLEGK